MAWEFFTADYIAVPSDISGSNSDVDHLQMVPMSTLRTAMPGMTLKFLK
ncbi:MAG: hypothetical protein WCE61_13955 [Candidatus Acidiferrum sp.]